MRSLFRTVLLVLSASLLAGTAAAAELRASKLMGMTVENRQGENLGEVRDLIVDLDRNHVRSLVMDVNRAFHLGANLYAVPVGEFTVKDNRLVVDADREKFTRARGFDRNKWPAYSDPYWAMVTPWPGGVPAPAGGILPDQPAGTGASAKAAPPIVRASDLLGRRDVKDLVVEIPGGQVRHALVERDGKEGRVALKELGVRP